MIGHMRGKLGQRRRTDLRHLLGPGAGDIADGEGLGRLTTLILSSRKELGDALTKIVAGAIIIGVALRLAAMCAFLPLRHNC
jgi:hypothetical protein